VFIEHIVDTNVAIEPPGSPGFADPDEAVMTSGWTTADDTQVGRIMINLG
jgi:hypothetical protein